MYGWLVRWFNLVFLSFGREFDETSVEQPMTSHKGNSADKQSLIDRQMQTDLNINRLKDVVTQCRTHGCSRSIRMSCIETK